MRFLSLMFGHVPGLSAAILLVTPLNVGSSTPSVNSFVYSLENRDDQTAFSGPIDSLTFVRGNARFHFGPGNVTLMDFGTGRVQAVVFKGIGTFEYEAPNSVEQYQLHKFTGKDSLNHQFESACFVFNMELDNLPDTLSLTRGEIDKDIWNRYWDAYEDAFEYVNVYLANMLIPDLIVDRPGYDFYADFDLKDVGHIVFFESLNRDDHYSLLKLKRKAGIKIYDVLGGYSESDDLVSQRGVHAIDVTSYDIESVIEDNGEMTCNCRIVYNPLRWGDKFLYFNWYGDNEVISVLGSGEDTLQYIGQRDEDGFGVILDEPTELGKPDHIDIRFKNKSLENVWGVYFVKEQAYWYPQYDLNDRATYELVFDSPKNYQVLSCGTQVESRVEDKRRISRWVLDYPVSFVSFNIGDFDSKEVSVEDLPPVISYLSKHFPHQEIALYLAATEGTLSSADMIGQVAADVTNSLAFYTSILGPCPFDTIRATEIPFGHGQGTPGLLLLSWATYQTESLSGSDVTFRAHEVSHLWWGNVVGWESYRDYWIIEALADYCGFWFYQMSSKNNKNCENILETFRKDVMSGGDVKSIGSKAGPPIIGTRLSSSDSDDYHVIVYEKGAYIFHMIRYMLHDYKTGSDDAFAAFLKDIVDTYGGKVITTRGLQSLLEKHVGAEMGWFFDQWVYGTEIPEYTFSYESEVTDDGKYAVVCHVKQEKVPGDFHMLVPITVLFEDDRYVHLKLWIDQPEADIDLPRLPFEPKKIVFNTYDAVLCKVKYK